MVFVFTISYMDDELLTDEMYIPDAELKKLPTAEERRRHIVQCVRDQVLVNGITYNIPSLDTLAAMDFTEGELSPSYKEIKATLAMSAYALAEQYGGCWGEHPDHPREGWREDVWEENTGLGYWEWVAHNIEMKEVEAS